MSYLHRVWWTSDDKQLAGDVTASFPVKVTDPALLDAEDLRRKVSEKTGREIPAPISIVSVRPVD